VHGRCCVEIDVPECMAEEALLLPQAQKEREETRPKPLLWSKSPNGFKLPESSSKAIMEEKGRIDALKKLRDYGILLVRNMPTDKYGVQKIAEQFGYVQQTIWVCKVSLLHLTSSHFSSKLKKRIESYISDLKHSFILF